MIALGHGRSHSCVFRRVSTAAPGSRPAHSQCAEGDATSSPREEVGAVLKLTAKEHVFSPPASLRRSRSWTEGGGDPRRAEATSPPPPPALIFDEDDDDAQSLAELVEPERMCRRTSLGEVAGEVASVGEQGSPTGQAGNRRRKRIARASSESRHSEDIEAAVSDAWATMERLDDLLLGGVTLAPGSPTSVLDGPGAADVLEAPDMVYAGKVSAADFDEHDENDNLQGELDELQKFQDAMKKELDILSLGESAPLDELKQFEEDMRRGLDTSVRGGNAVQLFLNGEEETHQRDCGDNDSIEIEMDELKRFEGAMEKDLDVSSLSGSTAQRFLENADEQSVLTNWLRGSSLIVDFPDLTANDVDGCRIRQRREWRRRRGRLIRAVVQFTGDIGLALRLLQFWRRRQSQDCQYQKDGEKKAPEGQPELQKQQQ